MELTTEEVKLVTEHREKQDKIASEQEALRRKARIYEEINKLLGEAKAYIVDAKRIAEDNNLKYEIEGLVTAMINEVSDGQYWYGSDQSLC